ncbi:MAG: flagellar biosynthesis protein FlgN [Alteromonadaceae bacterium]|nr:MAG: flagellar biosynthesis protein FlgN [Alteromonadaceae bacterium]
MTISAAAIERQISTDIDACNTLLELLSNEQEALKNRDPEALSQVIEAKISPLTHLEQSARQRADWTRSSEAGADSETWQKILDDVNSEKLQQDWLTLKELLKSCRHRNEVNGKLLIKNQQIFGRLLNIMRGQSTAPSLYSAKGSATAAGTSFKMGEA